MSKLKQRKLVGCLGSALLGLCGCGGGASTSTPPPPAPVQLSVQIAGTSSGTIRSSPSGIDCSPSCSADFVAGTQVTLTAVPSSNSFFKGWSGACSGVGVCKVTLTSNTSVV